MNIVLNGERRGVEGPLNLQQLLASLRVPTEGGVAVLLNGEVARRTLWADTAIQAEDEIEIVRATVGG